MVIFIHNPHYSSSCLNRFGQNVAGIFPSNMKGREDKANVSELNAEEHQIGFLSGWFSKHQVEFLEVLSESIYRLFSHSNQQKT